MPASNVWGGTREGQSADWPEAPTRVPNLVAGIYGMNFIHLWPPGAASWGFFAVATFLLIMVAWGFIHSKMLGWL